MHQWFNRLMIYYEPAQGLWACLFLSTQRKNSVHPVLLSVWPWGHG